MKLEIELADAIAAEVAKKDQRIASLEATLVKTNKRNQELEDIFKRLKKAKDALLDAADWIDPYRYDDD